MARTASLYFFSLSSGESLCSALGKTFVTDAAAKRFALSMAREIMSDAVKSGNLNLDERIEVLDELGATKFSVEFADALKIRGSGNAGSDA